MPARRGAAPTCTRARAARRACIRSAVRAAANTLPLSAGVCERVRPLGPRLDEVLLVRTRKGDEQAAVWALEALVADRGAAQELALEALAAMRADDLVRAAVVGGGSGSHL